MSDDWKVGDLALCIDDSRDSVGGGHSVVRGRIYTVASIHVYQNAGRWPTPLALKFVEIVSKTGFGWSAHRFIKVTPPEADAFDHETIELMNRKPVEDVS